MRTREKEVLDYIENHKYLNAKDVIFLNNGTCIVITDSTSAKYRLVVVREVRGNDETSETTKFFVLKDLAFQSIIGVLILSAINERYGNRINYGEWNKSSVINTILDVDDIDTDPDSIIKELKGFHDNETIIDILEYSMKLTKNVTDENYDNYRTIIERFLVVEDKENKFY